MKFKQLFLTVYSDILLSIDFDMQCRLEMWCEIEDAIAGSIFFVATREFYEI